VTHPLHQARTAADALVEELGAPDAAVVLGSGWAMAAAGLGTVSAETPMAGIPGSSTPSVEGHGKNVQAIDTSDKRVWVFGGRTHLYEGHGPHAVVHLVRAAVLAGSATVVLTNAAGALSADYQVGQPVLLADQLNLTGTTPLIGEEPPEGFPGRFCDLTEIYSKRLRAAVRDHHLSEGVYAGMLGGAYETPAEIRMLAGLGATVVGMSTVLEAIAAKHLGAEVAGVSLVTNMAAGLGDALSHQEVLDVAADSTGTMIDVVRSLVTAGQRAPR